MKTLFFCGLICILFYYSIVLKSFFSKTILKLEESTQRNVYRECFETGHIYSVKGCVQDDFILHKMYHILKLLCNISPKTRDVLEKKNFFV